VAVLERTELERSPLADLHAIASELGIEGFRRLRREELIGLLAGDADGETTESPATESPAPARRARRSTRSATSRRSARVAEREDAPAEGPERATRSRRPAAAEAAAEESPSEAAEEARTGVLELLPAGGGLVRRAAHVESPDDPYVSPAQIKRLELRAGDEVTGPVRPPRRSERHPALVRIDSVNGADAATGRPGRKRFEELTPIWATERLAVPDELSQAAPFGKGSRVALGGEPGVGATTLLRKILATLAERQPELQQAVVLAGARPEEVTDWRRDSSAAVTGGAFDEPLAELGRAAELAIEQAKRTVEQGGDALVAIDSLAFLPFETARAVFGAARNAQQGGSLTIVAVTGSSQDLRRLATTRVMLDAGSSGRFPGSVVSSASGTTRAELLG